LKPIGWQGGSAKTHREPPEFPCSVFVPPGEIGFQAMVEGYNRWWRARLFRHAAGYRILVIRPYLPRIVESSIYSVQLREARCPSPRCPVANPALKIKEFVEFARKLKGDEKGESQIFLDHLFQAFGHAGVIDVGGELEYRVRWNNSTKFADLVWPRRVLIEMKKARREAAKALPASPRILSTSPRTAPATSSCATSTICGFTTSKMSDPVDRVKVADLGTRYTVLSFLFPEAREPQFRTGLVAVTRKAAQAQQGCSREPSQYPMGRAEVTLPTSLV
jgi:hypothetical protein